MDNSTPPLAAEPALRLDPGPFLRQEGRPPRAVGRGDAMQDVARRYPRVIVRASRVPVWIGWVARRIGSAA